MTISTRLLLLLAAYSVSADQKERFFYHISIVHFSPFQTSSPEFPPTAGLDGESLLPEWTEESGRRRRREELMDLQTAELFIPLLEIMFNCSQGDVRNICEMERSSRGAVSSLTSADPGPDPGPDPVLCWTRTVDVVQCLVLDSDCVHRDEEDSPSLSQVCRSYLVQRCMERVVAGHNDMGGWRAAVTAGSEDDWFPGVLVTCLTLDGINNWLESNGHSVLLYSVGVWQLKKPDLLVLQFLAVFGVFNQDRVILTAVAVLAGCDLDIIILQGVLVLMFNLIWKYKYVVYFFAFLAFHKGDVFMVQGVALCGVYNQDRVILTGVAVLVIYYQYIRLKTRTVKLSSFLFENSFNLSDAIGAIHSVIFRIKRKIKKREAAKPPVKEAAREDLNVGDGDEGQNRLAAGRTPAGRRLAASMDIPLTLVGDDDDEEEDEGRNRLAPGLDPVNRRFAASMDISLTLADGDDDEGQNRLAAGLTPAGRRLAASMDIPLTLAGDDGQNRLGLTSTGRSLAASMDIPLTLAGEGENRLAQAAGLTPAGQRLAASMDIPLTLAETTEATYKCGSGESAEDL